MKTTTYRYPGTNAAVTLSRGVIIESTNPEAFPVGAKGMVAKLRACGWRLPKKVTQYDAFGRKID